MNNDHLNKQPQQKKALDTVTDFLDQNQAQKRVDGMNEVLQSAQIVKEGVADVVGEALAGMEAPSENISERNREDKKGDMKATSSSQTSDDDDQQQAQQIRSTLARRGEPTPKIMVAKIRTAIHLQIKDEMRGVKKLEKNLTAGTAQEYNVKIAKVRRLQETLASLINTAVEKLKEVYYKYFTAEGRRKAIDEI